MYFSTLGVAFVGQASQNGGISVRRMNIQLKKSIGEPLPADLTQQMESTLAVVDVVHTGITYFYAVAFFSVIRV